MWLQYLGYTALTFVLAVAAFGVIYFVIIWLDKSGVNRALGRVFQSLLEKPVAWSAGALAVLATFAYFQAITWHAALIAVLAVSGGLRLWERFKDDYWQRILAALGERQVQAALAVTIAFAAGAAAIWNTRTTNWNTRTTDALSTDPEVRRAKQRYKLLQTLWANVQDNVDNFDGRLETVRLLRNKSTYTLQEINELNANVQVHAGDLLGKLESLVAQLKAYQEPAADAAVVFRRAATALRNHAALEGDQHGFPQLAEGYREYAAFWEVIAAEHEQRERQPLNIGEIRELMRYFRRAQLMFARCGGLELIEGMELAEQQRRIEIDVEVFVATSDELRRAVRELTEQYKSRRPENSKPSDQPGDQRPADPNTRTADDRIASHIPPRDDSTAKQLPRPAADGSQEAPSAAPPDASPSALARVPAQRRGAPPTPSTGSDPVASNHDPFPKMNAEPQRILAATAQPFAAVGRNQAPVSRGDTGMPWDNADVQTESRRTTPATRTATNRRPTTPQNVWTPRAGQTISGSSNQVSDGGVNAANNNAVLNRELRIDSVSADGRRFFGVVTYTTYRVGGQTKYWGATAHAHGTIDGDRVTLDIDRAIYVPPGTFLSPGSCSGRIANRQIHGTWRAENGAYGNFDFQLAL